MPRAATPPLRLDTPVTFLKGCGPYLAQRLTQLGIETVGDLVLHLPSRYEDRRHCTAFAAWDDGAEAVFRARILHAEVRFAPRRSLRVLVEDDSGTAVLRLFHFHPNQQATLAPGRWVQGYGSGRRSREGLGFVHPSFEVADDPAAFQLDTTLTPVYPSTQGLAQARLRTLIDRALVVAADDPAFRQPIPGLAEVDTLSALIQVHRPRAELALSALSQGRPPAQLRLIDEELLAHQLSLRWLRRTLQQCPAPPIGAIAEAEKTLSAGLPFALTGAQRRGLRGRPRG